MQHDEDTIRLWDLARSVIKSLPDSRIVNQGLLRLATLRPQSTASIGLLLQQQAARYPKRIALRFEERSWTFDEFNRWANRIAATLRAAGVRRGDSVALLMENRAETLACVAGVIKLCAVAGMLNHQQRGEVLTHSLKLINPRAMIVGAECLEALAGTPFTPQEAPDRVHFWEGEGAPPAGYRGLREESAETDEGNPPEPERLPARSPCFYIFTSGTTGLPKASVMTHYRWLKGAAGLGQMSLRLRPEDVFYCCLPLYHNNALTVSWGAALSTGAALALARKFSVSRFWDDVRDHGATVFCYIGELCRYLLNAPARDDDRSHSVRVVVGNGLRPEIWDAFKTRFGIDRICEFYGASESNAAFVNGFGLDRTAGFCPLPYRIVAFDAAEEQPVRGAGGFMRKVQRGEVGLLITEVSEKNPFDGYTDRKASEAKLLRDVFRKGDCWFNSGDLVRDQGLRHIQFVDRVGDTFRWKGENVATTEVEGALNRFPGVEHAVVYGVQVPDSDGRAGMAALSWAGGALDGGALARHLLTLLPGYAVPLFLRLPREQAVTGTFKFRKVELKQQGFDPALIDEPLYVLLDRGRGYQILTTEIFSLIHRGGVRF
jgi:acyl-CoA synthetase (AMP-forming)/AMP-acid ligase II